MEKLDLPMPSSVPVLLFTEGKHAYICFRANGQRVFLIVEDGYFYQMTKHSLYRLNMVETLKVIFGITEKRLKIDGLGFYGQSVVASTKNSNVKEVG